MASFTKIEQMIPKFVWNHIKNLSNQSSLKNKAESFMFPDLKLCYKAVVIKPVWSQLF